jgi:hypothetical protein
VMTDRDTTTRTRARAPGVGGVFHRMAVHDRVLRPDSERTTVATTKCTKGGCKLDGGRRMPGAGLSRRSPRKAPLGQSAFQPYWGKLAVRNDRGDRGNVGIIRSPISASILPDPSRTSAPGPACPTHIVILRSTRLAFSRAKGRRPTSCAGEQVRPSYQPVSALPYRRHYSRAPTK